MEIDPTPSASISEFTSTLKLQEKIKNLPGKSYILEGEEKDEIHKENVDRLKGMTEEEIINEQQTLIDALDPEIVKFFKSKRIVDNLDSTEEKKEEKEYKEEVVQVDQIETAKEVIQRSEKWLHFNEVETEKMQWMKNIVVPKKPTSNENYEAR